MKRSPQRGFTLIELLIVVAIIGILAAIAMVNFVNAQIRAKIARVEGDMRSIATAIESYRIDNSEYPPTAGQLELTTPIAYITTFPKSPFDEPGYHKPVTQRTYWLPRQRWENRLGNSPTFLLTTARPADRAYNPDINAVDEDGDGRGDDLQYDMLYMVGIPFGYESKEDVPQSVQWNLKSVGPDSDDDRVGIDPNTPNNKVYDPTNGVRSDGDVLRFGPGWGMVGK